MESKGGMSRGTMGTRKVFTRPQRTWFSLHAVFRRASAAHFCVTPYSRPLYFLYRKPHCLSEKTTLTQHFFSFSAPFSFSTSQKEQLFHAFVSRLFLRVGVRWRARVRAGPVVLKKEKRKKKGKKDLIFTEGSRPRSARRAIGGGSLRGASLDDKRRRRKKKQDRKNS